jgi:hypothetical protein
VFGEIARLFEAGSLKASVGALLPLAEGRQAHGALDGTRLRVRGKIVLTADA